MEETDEKMKKCDSEDEKIDDSVSDKIEIELDDAEKAEILKLDTILLNKYSFIPDEMEGCHNWHEIINMENFTEEEREEIDEDNIDIDFLDDDDDWTSDYETIFELSGGYDLVEETEK